MIHRLHLSVTKIASNFLENSLRARAWNPSLNVVFFFLSRLVANALDLEFCKGDTIAIDMPMTNIAVIIYLAVILAGLVVVSIADSFAPKEIATRLRVSKAKAIFTQVVIKLTLFQIHT